MERRGIRRPVLPPPRKREIGREIVKWLQLLAVLLLIEALPVRTGYTYVVLPPLVVTFVEFSRPEAGLRKATGQIFGLIAAAAQIPLIIPAEDLFWYPLQASARESSSSPQRTCSVARLTDAVKNRQYRQAPNCSNIPHCQSTLPEVTQSSLL